MMHGYGFNADRPPAIPNLEDQSRRSMPLGDYRCWRANPRAVNPHPSEKRCGSIAYKHFNRTAVGGANYEQENTHQQQNQLTASQRVAAALQHQCDAPPALRPPSS